MAVSTGMTFGTALCKHFGLAANKVSADIKVNAGRDELFSVSLNIMLSPEDLAGIAVHMAADAPKARDTSVDSIKREIMDALSRAGR